MIPNPAQWVKGSIVDAARAWVAAAAWIHSLAWELQEAMGAAKKKKKKKKKKPPSGCRMENHLAGRWEGGGCGRVDVRR